MVAGWMAEVQGDRLTAVREIELAQPSGQLTKKQVKALVMSLKNIASVLATADPKLEAKVYAELGISVTLTLRTGWFLPSHVPKALVGQSVSEGGFQP
jgi:hypothetical protein